MQVLAGAASLVRKWWVELYLWVRAFGKGPNGVIWSSSISSMSSPGATPVPFVALAELPIFMNFSMAALIREFMNNTVQKEVEKGCARACLTCLGGLRLVVDAANCG